VSQKKKHLKDHSLLEEAATSRAERIERRQRQRGRRRTTTEVLLNAGLWGATILIGFIAIAWHSTEIVNWVTKL